MNLHWQRLPLEVTDPKASIKACKPLHDHLENSDPLTAKQEEAMLQALNAGIDSPIWTEIQEELTQKHCVPVLEHDNAQILSLPWRLATMPDRTGNLHTQTDLHLARTLNKVWDNTPFVPDIAPPLRVLVVISSPADTEQHRRLSYEDEEMQIQQAFLPLLEKGLVQLDFAEDGCLETLASRIKARPYHIVHYSGHGTFRNGQGWLEMEDFITLKKRLVSGQEFAAALKSNPSHTVPLVVLNSCQTSMGSSDTKEIRGLSLRLVEMGIPAVIGMGASVIDKFATDFAAKLYQEIASKQSLPTAFSAAIRHIHTTEQAYRNSRGAGVARQYLIPQLYLSCPIERLADWSKAPEEVTYDSVGFLNLNRLSDTKFHQEANQKFLFIGRRKEKRALLPPLIASQPVMLLGQGGLGKTSLAGHLVTRLISYEPKTQPFFFDETSFSVTKVQQEIEFWLEDHLSGSLKKEWREDIHYFKPREGEDPAIGRLRIHFRFLKEVSAPVLLFDNLESFQSGPGGAQWAEEFQAELGLLAWLITEAKVKLILTGRYPIPELSSVVTSVNLNTVSLGDFRKKIQTMQLGTLAGSAMFTKKGGNVSLTIDSFDDLVKLLHKGMGGSYRALEWVDVLYQEQQEQGLLNTLPELAKFATEQSVSVRQDMAKNLVFDTLLDLLSEAHHQILGWLQHFTIPVQPLALALQGADRDSLPELLDRLHRLTIIERHDNPVLGDTWYLAPLAKELWINRTKHQIDFSPEKAGIYHYAIFSNYFGGNPSLGYDQAIASVNHLLETQNYSILNNLGRIIIAYHLDRIEFSLAKQWGVAIYISIHDKDAVDPVLKSLLGTTLWFTRQKKQSLELLLQAEAELKGQNELEYAIAKQNKNQYFPKYFQDGEDSISQVEECIQIFHRYGEVEKFWNGKVTLGYLNKAKGATSNAIEIYNEVIEETPSQAVKIKAIYNLSQVYIQEEKYDEAEKLLQAGISFEFLDPLSKASFFLNLGQVKQIKNEPQEEVLHWLNKSKEISEEIGDYDGLIFIASTIQNIYYERGDFEDAEKVLQETIDNLPEEDFPGQLSNLRYNLSKVKYSMGDEKGYCEEIMKAFKLVHQAGHPEGIFMIAFEVSMTLKKMGKKDLAVEVFKKSMNSINALQSERAQTFLSRILD